MSDVILRAREALFQNPTLPPDRHYALRDALDAGHAAIVKVIGYEVKDRTALITIAGNIAAGLAANPSLTNFTIASNDITRPIARTAVTIARAIIDEIDNPTPARKEAE